MKTTVLALIILLIGFNALAKPKASGFKEIYSADDAEKPSDETSEEDEEPKVVLKENEEVLSGTVRVLRKIDQTEVFFKDIKGSYYIPSGMNHSSLFKAFTQSQKDGKPVTFKVNTKNQHVLSLESAPVAKPAAGSVSTESPSKTGSGSR